jgi:hypothetical protein
MKYNKIISITLVNSFLILAFASFLASCNKQSIKPNGMLSNYLTTSPSRGIASINFETPLSKFKEFQDPKQIIVYCSNQTKKIKTCYNNELSKLMSEYKSQYPRVTNQEIALIQENVKFETIKRKLDDINLHIQHELQPKINKLTQKREEFCKINSKNLVKRCLEQYLSRDTFAVLNNFQIKKNKMNAHEYLYYKEFIQKRIKSNLELSYNNLKN